MNLYQINEQIENFDFIYDEETGEVMNMGMLDELNIAKEEKIENIALFIKNLNSDTEALDSEIKALQERKKQKQSKAKNLQNYLESALDGNKFETPKCLISFRKSTSVDVEEEKFIEFAKTNHLEDLYKVEVKEKANKTNIKKYIKENGVVPYARLVENKNIQIK